MAIAVSSDDMPYGSVSAEGDTMSEPSAVPPAAAGQWYTRQALGFVAHAACLPGLALALVLTGRMLLDVVTPVNDLAARAAMTTYLAILIFTLAGFFITYRTHRTASAPVVAVVATAIATAAQFAIGSAATAAAGSRLPADSPTMRALVEGLDIPVIPILVIGVLAASLGGWSARMFATRAPGSRWSMRA
jgi:hypothetical protein